MARSIRKGPYVDANLDEKVMAMAEGKAKKGVIKTWSRRSTITPDFVGTYFRCTQWQQVHPCVCN